MANRHILISADGHCGASIEDYRAYLDPRFYAEFDDWAADYSDAWGAIDEESAASGQAEAKIGVSSFMAPVNWDSSLRQSALDGQGIAAEILFPNTVPPFYPSGSITSPGPTNPAEYERRFAGIKAHNRWLADFCKQEPQRRAGVAQVFLNDVDAAIAEIAWAKENGLRGILLPADHFHLLNNLYYPKFFPIWEVAAELDMPIHRHGVVPSEAASEQNGMAAPAIGLLEAHYFSTRGLAHMVLSGAFEKFPKLKFVLAETGSAWLGAYAHNLDSLAEQSRKPGTVTSMFSAAAFERLSLKPSEYIDRNCWVGSFFSKADIAARHETNTDHLMWGADFPHHEGTSPYTTKATQINFGDVPDDEARKMLSSNAIECYGFDREYLQGVADRIGPTPEEIHTPLALSDYPRYPEDTVCPTFALDMSAFSPGQAAAAAAS